MYDDEKCVYIAFECVHCQSMVGQPSPGWFSFVCIDCTAQHSA